MPIKERIDENTGKKFYDVYTCVQSKLFPHLRKQKRRCRLETKFKAQRTEQLLLKQCHEEILIEENKGNLWGEVVNKWLAFEKTNFIDPIGKDTLQDYFNSLRIWTKPFWTLPASQISKNDIRRVIVTLEDAGRSKSYQAKVKQTINKVYNWGIEEGLINNVLQSPTVGIKVNRKKEKVPEILSLSEVRRFLDCAKKLDHPWYPVWATAVLSGCRNGELYALTWDDIDFEKEFIRVSKSYNTRHRIIKSTKAGYWRNVPMNSDLKQLLIELKSQSLERKEVLPRLNGWDKGNQAKVLRDFLAGIGLPSVKFHTLRACFATILLQQSVAPATVMKICGWKDLDTMARYIRLAAIDEKGATDSLIVLPKLATENVVNIFKN